MDAILLRKCQEGCRQIFDKYQSQVNNASSLEDMSIISTQEMILLIESIIENNKDIIDSINEETINGG